MMTPDDRLPDLTGWEPTRDTLGVYARVIGAVPRVLAKPHPKWWHISLRVTADGLATGAMPLPGQEAPIQLGLDLRRHALYVDFGEERIWQAPLADGPPPSELADILEGIVRKHGAQVKLDRDRLPHGQPDAYDPQVGRAYLQALHAVHSVLEKVRDQLPGDRGPIQLWPHHFDLAFEWFGTKSVEMHEEGQERQAPAQLNFGFAPGDASFPEPYFYSNPWPFPDDLLELDLPGRARWHTKDWKGSMLPYSGLAGEPGAGQSIEQYYLAVFAAASPYLMT
jgi:hypothetical protein